MEDPLHLFATRTSKLVVRRLRSVPSTNTWLLDHAASERPSSAVVVVAEQQTGGRGQHGRRWLSPEGRSVAFSYLPEPARRDGDPPLFSMAAGLALWTVLRQSGIGDARLKWPNDVLVGGRKLAGILVEARTSGMDRIGPVLGIGFNLATREHDFPPELREKATSLRQLGLDDLDANRWIGMVLDELQAHLELAHRNAAQLADRYLDALELRGRRVELDGPRGSQRGILVGLDPTRGARWKGENGLSETPFAFLTALRAEE